MGTVPMGIADAPRIFLLHSLISPPVERSMTVSVPADSATLNFSSSSSINALSEDVPMLAFTFINRPSPMPQGMRPL